MKCNIHTVRDLSQKIGESVCRYKKIPYWVRIEEDRHGRPLIQLCDIGDGTVKHSIKYDDPDFDISSVPLGYCQKHDDCKVSYLIRLSLRRVRQGVCAQNVRCIPIQGVSWAGPSYIIRTKAFYNMVVGDYIPLDVGLDTLRKRLKDDKEFIGEVAISRKIALSINKLGIVNVYFKQELVGWMEPDKFVVHIPHSDLATIVSKYLSHVLGWEID